MAIVFVQQKRVQKSLIFILAAILVITAIVIWQGFFKKEVSLEKEISLPRQEIKINFEFLKDSRLEKLSPFLEIEPIEETPLAEGEPGEKIGRENPFIPY